MTKIALRIRVCADDWAAESAIKASNGINVTVQYITLQNQKCSDFQLIKTFL